MSNTLSIKRDHPRGGAVPTAPKSADHAASERAVVGSTTFGKDLEVFRNNGGRTFAVRFVGGGQLPEKLQGIFTRFADADQAVIQYLSDNASTLAPLPAE